MEDFVLSIDDDLQLSSAIHVCRICHEQEFETSKNLEAPCACSGTVKFAHRDCIQRWCNEKGNTICEICLQKFEPGYKAPSKKAQLVDTTLTIRGSSEIPRREAEEENGDVLEIDDYSQECNSASHTNAASCCRSMAVTLLIVKASGILLPMYILIQLINKIQSSLKQHDQSSDNVEFSSDGEEGYESGRFNNIEIQSQ
ncbi:E3 ubiquitin- ligase MARCH1-like isoform X1 [Olea europaea subsp. europaea]|uniref:E3 ubiquitin- ligase MARCH1-like isoform X1 n=1 Tax=Olea europaea subsp. europaea TaxID=158383 RepID=A0A8S0THI1_OLEEU|nr:E3 ubiquitin- ligase MARCH1-like isoform X1 [Olea europaea subsp. europaea]